MIIKVQHKSQIHVLSLPELDYLTLLFKIHQSFTKLPSTTKISLYYIDEEGDKVSVTTTQDLRAISECVQTKIVKLIVEDVSGKNQEPLIQNQKIETENKVASILIQNQKAHEQFEKIFGNESSPSSNEKKEIAPDFAEYTQATQTLYKNIPIAKNIKAQQPKQKQIASPSKQEKQEHILIATELLHSTYNIQFEDALEFATKHRQKTLEQICALHCQVTYDYPKSAWEK